MSMKKLMLLLSLMMLLAGCGGSERPQAKAPPSNGYGQGQYPASEEVVDSSSSSPGSFGGSPTADSAPPSPSQPSALPSGGAEARASRPRETAPDLRPGLGTEWGESRTSRVHDVTFVRDSSRPFAIAQLHYNDRRGADALANVAGRRDVTRDLVAGGGAVTVSIRDASGKPLEAMHTGGKTIVVGNAGQRYSIVLENHTSHRFEAVATVDGLDVVNGKSGTFENRGYILMPFATLEIDGFRQSSNAVAAFRFGAVGDSYAAQSGTARNVGVIGVAFFGERGDAFVPENEARLRDTASPFPSDPRFAQPPRR